MYNDKWSRRYLNIAKEFSRFSKDPSTQVGAVIVDDLGRVVGSGFNGFPRGVHDSEDRYLNRELKYKLICHAEQNAIWMAGTAARGCKIYVYPSFAIPNVCHECAKAVIQSGIKSVVGFVPEAQDDRAVRWQESIDLARTMLEEAGVRIEAVER